MTPITTSAQANAAVRQRNLLSQAASNLRHGRDRLLEVVANSAESEDEFTQRAGDHIISLNAAILDCEGEIGRINAARQNYHRRAA